MTSDDKGVTFDVSLSTTEGRAIMLMTIAIVAGSIACIGVLALAVMLGVVRGEGGDHRKP